MQGLIVLSTLTAVMLIMLVLCVYGPLILQDRSYVFDRHSTALASFFVSLGSGFMFMEISLLQRLSVFLGHPTYGLSIVLFSILIFSGLGSLLSPQLRLPVQPDSPVLKVVLVAVTLSVVGALMIPTLHLFEASNLLTRILISVVILAPIGFAAGMAFPTGMRLAIQTSPNLIAWFWALNGAASVLGCALATLISVTLSISASYTIACLFYFIAALSLHLSLPVQPGNARDREYVGSSTSLDNAQL